jgi:glycosyltransferase involved in cell wall biosynthesis/GT2 family glycosyltransferase
MPRTVSVVIPAHNARLFLGEALDSVLAQTRPPEQIIVVDDGSTDGTAELARAWCTERGVPITLLQQPNRGVSAARNVGIQAAQTDLVALLDADDLFLPDHLERLQRGFDHAPESVLCFADAEVFTASGVTRPSFLAGTRIDTVPTERRTEDGLRVMTASAFASLLWGSYIPTATTVFDRSAAVRAGLFGERFQGAEDRDFMLRMSRLGRFSYYPMVLARKREHSANVSGPSHVLEYARGQFQVLRETARAVDVLGLTIGERTAVHQALADHVVFMQETASQCGLHAYLAACAFLARHGVVRTLLRPRLFLRALAWPILRRRAERLATRGRRVRSSLAQRSMTPGSRSGAAPKRIALIEPLGDPGIGTYTYELAEAISASGIVVDVYTAGRPWTLALPRRHRLFPVLGSSLLLQRDVLTAREPVSGGPAWLPAAPPAVAPTFRPGIVKRALRESYLAIELACWLRVRRYDLVWTQWPTNGEGGISFWSAARALGLPLVHTAHNIFPHERTLGDRERYGHVYQRSRAILVHSYQARDILIREFPWVAEKVLVSAHGLYTSYPPRPDARDSVRRALGIAPDVSLALLFGGIRPYKNLDGIIRALAAERSGKISLLVAGRESGYPDSRPDDPLARTRRLAAEWNVQDRVHLRPGPFGYEETAGLFAASDIVLLPYVETYGSGLLLLAMSFGKHVIATSGGGMDEYLHHYPAHVLLDAPTDDAIVAALRQTVERLGAPHALMSPRPAQFEWPHIVRELLPRLFDLAAAKPRPNALRARPSAGAVKRGVTDLA